MGSIPFLLLSLALLVGAGKIALTSHRRIAMQSRLDVCASRIWTSRQQVLEKIEDQNRIIKITETGVLMARGLKIFSGPAGAFLSHWGEKVLVQMNQKAALIQDTLVRVHSMQEAKAIFCSPTPFSKELAHCRVNPKVSQLLQRRPAVFPDIKGPLNPQKHFAHLGSFLCSARSLATSLVLTRRGEKVYEQ